MDRIGLFRDRAPHVKKLLGNCLRLHPFEQVDDEELEYELLHAETLACFPELEQADCVEDTAALHMCDMHVEIGLQAAFLSGFLIDEATRPNGLQMTPVERQAWKSSRDSHIRKPSTAAD